MRKLNRPRGRVSLRVEDAHIPVVGAVAGDDVLAIRRDIDVVYGPFRTDALDFGERSSVDDIRDAWVVPNFLPDPHIDSTPIRSDRDVIGVTGERDLFDHL